MDVGEAISKFAPSEMLQKGTEAYLRVSPGRSLVSSARATIRADQLFDEQVSRLIDVAKREAWPEDYLAWRVEALAVEMGKKANLDAIAQFASKMLKDGSSITEEDIDKIDSEWVNYFVDHASKVTDEDMREIWGAVLAGEINNPGRFSKRTLSVVADLGKAEAESFKKVCSYIIDASCGRMLALQLEDDYASYNNGSISYYELSELASRGLFALNGAMQFPVQPDTWETVIDGDLIVSIGGDGRQSRDAAQFSPSFTRVGLELSTLCNERDVKGIIKALDRKRDLGKIGLIVKNRNGDVLDPKDL